MLDFCHDQKFLKTKSSDQSGRLNTLEKQSHPKNSALSIQRATLLPNSLNYKDSLQIQRTLGNQALGKLLKSQSYKSLPIQAKLQVGSATDPYEKEADQVAYQLVNRSLQSEQIFQKDLEKNKGQENPIQKKSDSEAKSLEQGFTVNENFEKRLNQTQGSGASLPKSLQNDFGGKLGVDLGQVRIHTNKESSQLNQEIQAKAFTHKKDIYFGENEYNPGSNEGKFLIAHELAHVVQQTNGLAKKNIKDFFPSIQRAPKILSNTDDLIEIEQKIAKLHTELALEIAQTTIDIAGIADPTPTSDILGAMVSLVRRDYPGALLSIISAVPYLGDAVAKPIKIIKNNARISKILKEIESGIEVIRKTDPKKAQKELEKLGESIGENLDQIKIPNKKNIHQDSLESIENNLKKQVEEFQKSKESINYPPLKKLHGETQSSLEYWRKKDTKEIIDSLKAGEERLIVKSDGTIMQGHNRIKILQERGIDISKLPRELYTSHNYNVP